MSGKNTISCREMCSVGDSAEDRKVISTSYGNIIGTLVLFCLSLYFSWLFVQHFISIKEKRLSSSHN